LAADDRGYGAIHDALKLGAHKSDATGFALDEHVNDRLAAGQTPHVRGQDALGTQFQSRSLPIGAWMRAQVVTIRNLKQV
jgi:hypothetical protein